MQLEEAQTELFTRLNDGKHAICPCCEQNCKVYKRQMTGVTGAVMITMLRESGREYVHIPTLAHERMSRVAHQGGYLTMSHYWGLIEEAQQRTELGIRSGAWRLTEKGEVFVQNETMVPRYAYVYNGNLELLAGEPVSIIDVLGKKFNYYELMA